jgi:hypothetical protein
MPVTAPDSLLRRIVNQVKRVLLYLVITAFGLLVLVAGLKFYADTLDACQAEGDSYAFCLGTLEYQTFKQVVRH